MIKRLAATSLAFVAAGLAVPVASPAMSQAGWYDGACTDNIGITVVIDFQDLGGGVNVRCAPGPVTSGLDALDTAGIAWEPTRRFAGFVCRIAGRPGPDTEPCGDTPPATAYWSYWVAQRGGTWCYSNFGAGNRTPPPGTVEGWSFSLNRTGSQTPPPGYAPPAPIPGEPANPLKPSDCTVPTPTPTPTSTPASVATTVAATAPPATPAPTTAASAPTTVRPPTQSAATTAPPIAAPPVAVGGGGSPPAASSPSAGVRPGTPGAGAGVGTSGASLTTTTDAGPTSAPGSGSGTTTTTASNRPSTTLRTSSDDATPQEESASASPPDGSELTGSSPRGTVDLGDDGRGDGGFGVGSALGITLAGVLATAGIFAARRRRGSP